MRNLFALTFCLLLGCARSDVQGVFEAQEPEANEPLIAARAYLQERLKETSSADSKQRQTLANELIRIEGRLKYDRYKRAEVTPEKVMMSMAFRDKDRAIVSIEKEGHYHVLVKDRELKLSPAPGGAVVMDHMPKIVVIASDRLLLDDRTLLLKVKSVPNP